MKREKNAVTLLELILAIVFLSVIVLGINSIYYFSHFQTVNTDRRARLQNQLSIAVEHMRKEIGKAIGNEAIDGADQVIDTTSGVSGNTAIKVYVDSGTAYVSGVNAIYRVGDGRRGTASDRWIAYRWTGAAGITGVPNSQYEISFCPRCLDIPNCTVCNAGAWGVAQNVVAKNISAFIPVKTTNTIGQLNNNSITVAITACWDPSIVESVDNPCVNTTTSLITMPSVTAH